MTKPMTRTTPTGLTSTSVSLGNWRMRDVVKKVARLFSPRVQRDPEAARLLAEADWEFRDEYDADPEAMIERHLGAERPLKGRLPH